MQAMKLPSLALLGLTLVACGGGSSNNTPSIPTTTVVTQLSADQAAFESMVLAPNAVYVFNYALPTTGQASTSYYFYDLRESLQRSPLSNDVQRIVSEAPTAVAKNGVVPDANTVQNWYVVNGRLVQEAYPYITEYSYKEGSVLEEVFATDKTTPAESGMLTNISRVALSGTVIDAPSDFRNYVVSLFSNTALLKKEAAWAEGAAYMKFTYTTTQDSYRVDADNGTVALFPKTKLSDKFNAGGITYKDIPYTSASGALSTVNGIPTYVATSALSTSTPPRYRAFYEIGGDIYAGTLTKAGAQNTVVRYNTPARTSLQAALTF